MVNLMGRKGNIFGKTVEYVKKFNDLIFISPSNINPEFTNNSLYFFETSLAAVLLPLADSPSHAIINFLNFFTKT